MKGGSRIHKLKRLYKVGRSARMVSSDEASLVDQEDASKQERKINDIDKDAKITLVDETQGMIWLMQESAKKQKVHNDIEEDDTEEAELKDFLEIIPDKEEITIDVVPLAVKSPSIVD
ncbi:hypothetical protein Tco_0454720 [Tanacetum coccineum]